MIFSPLPASDRKRGVLLFLTIVVPVFNVAPYLVDCLRSVLVDPNSDFEVVAIDDGSTDSSADVLHSLSLTDERIRAIYSPHRGLGAARNLGISLARGKYVVFLDSDDWLAPGALEMLRAETQKSGCELVSFDTQVIFDEEPGFSHKMSSRLYYRRRRGLERASNGEQLLESLARKGAWLPSACLFVVKREVLVKHNIAFREGALLEDHAFTYQVFSCAQTAKHLNLRLHKRRVRRGSITQDGDSLQLLTGYLLAINDVISLSQKNGTLHARSTAVILNRMGCSAASLSRRVSTAAQWRATLLAQESMRTEKISQALSHHNGSRLVPLLRWLPGNLMAKRILRSLA